MGGCRWLPLAICLVALAPGLAAAASPALRGLNPEFASRYSGEKGLFTCLDGTKTIPFSRVNDDYCDCPDGSDEPGTPACYNGRFYCRNLGHEPKLLSTSFVDDGICDCCDGSDEPKGYCKNNCLQQSAAQRETLKQQVDHFAQALQKKAQYIQQAQEKLTNWQARQQTIDTEIEAQKALVEQLRVEKEKDEAERAAKAAEEAERRAAEEAARAAEQAASGEAAEAEQVPADGTEAAGEGADAAAADDSAEATREETAEEIGRRIASQWTNDPEAAGVPKEDEPLSGEEGDEAEGGEGDVEEGGEGEDEHDHDADLDDHQHYNHQYSGYSEVTQKFYDGERKLRELEDEKQKIDRYLGASWDYGPGNKFLQWAGQCFTAFQTRWTYEACPFSAATQSENYANKVNVGRFKSFENNYTEMLFTDGDYCHGTGPRSIRVKLVCGLHEQLKDAEEPATCQYTATLTTPLACTEEDMAKAQAQYDHLLQQEREIQAQIDAMERDEL